MSVLEQQQKYENSPDDEWLYADPNADPHVGRGPKAPTAKCSDGTTSMSQNTSPDGTPTLNTKSPFSFAAAATHAALIGRIDTDNSQSVETRLEDELDLVGFYEGVGLPVASKVSIVNNNNCTLTSSITCNSIL